MTLDNLKEACERRIKGQYRLIVERYRGLREGWQWEIVVDTGADILKVHGPILGAVIRDAHKALTQGT